MPPESVLEKTDRHWQLDGPYPLPRGGWLGCPVCHEGNPIPKLFVFYEHSIGSSHPYRCDATFKCDECAAVWQHGIVISDAVFHRYVGENERRIIPRLEIKAKEALALV